jgi:transposase InsO family protein
LYKWLDRPLTPRQQRRAELDVEVLAMFTASRHTYGSPRIHADLLEFGWSVSVNTVADSMRRQGLQGRKPKHSKGLTRQDRKAPKFPDLLQRDFTAPAPNRRWCGDFQCRRRHWMSYADFRTMPTLGAMTQVSSGVEVRKVGIVV